MRVVISDGGQTYKYDNLSLLVIDDGKMMITYKDENGETHLRYINGTQVHLNESSDIYVPEYVNDLNKALLMIK